eukprot:287893-Prorocentrum_minimum.AAC.1
MRSGPRALPSGRVQPHPLHPPLDPPFGPPLDAPSPCCTDRERRARRAVTLFLSGREGVGWRAPFFNRR